MRVGSKPQAMVSTHALRVLVTVPAKTDQMFSSINHGGQMNLQPSEVNKLFYCSELASFSQNIPFH